MAKLKGKRVLITGAAGGIGRCLAGDFAKAGSELILTDVNESALMDAAHEMRGMGVTVHTRVVDIADREQVEALAQWVENDLGGLDILINNAGIGHSGEIVETSLDTWKRLMDVNFWGALNHVYAFLPAMMTRKSGHIVTVSSGQAFFRLPTWGPYATIKLALGAFSEILRYEVRKFGIKVTTVYPFMVNTPFYSDIEGETWSQKLSMKLVPYYSMSPERVARIIFKAIKKRKSIEMVSPLNDIAKYIRAIPFAPNVVGTMTMLFLGKSKKDMSEVA